MWYNSRYLYYTCIFYILHAVYPNYVLRIQVLSKINLHCDCLKCCSLPLFLFFFFFLGTELSELLDVFISLASLTVGNHYQTDMSVYFKSNQAVVQYNLLQLLIALSIRFAWNKLDLVLMNVITVCCCITQGELICLHMLWVKGYYPI